MNLIVYYLNIGEEKMFVNLSLEELQNRVQPPPYKPVFLKGESVPIHLNEKLNLLNGELNFQKFPDYCKKYWENKNIQMEISNKGRIKIDGKIEKQYLNSKNVLHINIPGVKDPQRVWTLVALAWRNGNNTADYYDRNTKRTTVHHLDNNGYNNDYNNLLWVTPSEHEMIHIKGIWKHENVFMEFYKNEFIIYNNNIEFYHGTFSFIDDKIEKYTTHLKLVSNDHEIIISHKNIEDKKIKILNGFKENQISLDGYWERFEYKLNRFNIL
jgi:hypothetical protein